MAPEKLLLVSRTIPPAHGGSAYITHQLAKGLPPKSVCVVGGARWLFPCKADYDGVEYKYLFSEINWRGHGDRFFEPLRWLLFPCVLWQLYGIARRQKSTLVLATFPDGYYLLAAWIVARMRHLRFYTYFHNTYADNRTGIAGSLARSLQRRYFRDSARIFTMSEGMNAHFAKMYPDTVPKLEVLPHTFSAPRTTSTTTCSAELHHPCRLVFIGTINQSNVEATRRMFQVIARHPERWHLDIYSPSNKNLLEMKYGLDLSSEGIVHRGSVPQEEVHTVLQECDICLLTHGFSGEYSEVEYQTIFPTRTIPLLLSGRPILAHSPPHAFLTRFLAERDCAEIVSVDDPDALEATLDGLIAESGRRALLVRNQLETAAYFYGPDVVARLRTQLGMGLE
ncbi:MAG: glycosyltransferase [Saprospiraceae bacterium]|jgi:glycosyltransferase involved in cell wall biosynthesis|nr:glycosyltransferase [Saprospiraceae bacterium]MBP9210996.1 glycosyltransferase [Saprospiraceae bacterium]MBV6474196.1 hypothetical protein [Saprospiraceae bacterium]